jgi:hypothetical protein
MKRIALFVSLFFTLSIAAFAQQPCPAGRQCSGSVTFTVTYQAPPTPASISPSSVVVGASSTTITLSAASGDSFNNTMIVEMCSITPTPCAAATDLTTTFVSQISLTAAIPAAQLANSGTFAIYISQPLGGHGLNANNIETLSETDKTICTSCTKMKAEVLQTFDFVKASKG